LLAKLQLQIPMSSGEVEWYDMLPLLQLVAMETRRRCVAIVTRRRPAAVESNRLPVVVWFGLLPVNCTA
jgi:hypothetical protein